MAQNTDLYANNPLIHKNRQLSQSTSSWSRSFSCETLAPLIVCRGPIRKEAMDVFTEMGINHYGILLSEKDSIVYPNALSPELRQLTDTNRVHRVPDYSGASKEERLERIQQIIDIAKENGYDSVFAGYGFMAEDDEFVAALETAGLNFIGPCSGTQRAAGKKDEAKRTALQVDVSVTPGIDNVTVRTLLKKHKTFEQLIALVAAEDLDINKEFLKKSAVSLEDLANTILTASYKKGIDLYSIEELCSQVEIECAEMFKSYPSARIRLKAIGGGGGKGQRILGAALLITKKPTATQIKEAASVAPGLVREILNEVKTNGVGDNKNVLIELNIEQTRHNEIQLLGNGSWCIALGGRDCSLQMHEQKLLEISVTQESLLSEIAKAKQLKLTKQQLALEEDLEILKRMEAESERFGEAVKLDSASTFECIVDGNRHYFMEVNTRIQVEHRVTELVYRLKFTNPEDQNDFFIVESLVEAMALLAVHKERLPRPTRLPRFGAAAEARLNATDCSLSPSAGGYIRYWSKPIAGEIRDDQGICIPNPDTDQFMLYHLAGAYDSNIALLLSTGENRSDSYDQLAKILHNTVLRGPNLATNLGFHYGLLNWFIGNNVMAKPTTRFVVPYLTLVGKIKEEAQKLDVVYAFMAMKKHYAKLYKDAPDAAKAASATLDRKGTLLTRPMEILLQDPHLLSGWLSLNRKKFEIVNGSIVWLCNPLVILEETYEYLNMTWRKEAPATEVIWNHDRDLLNTALSFYAELREKFSIETSEFTKMNEILSKTKPQGGYSVKTWDQIQAAHVGYKIGNELLGLLCMVAEKIDFYDFKVEENLEVTIPEYLHDPGLQATMKKILVPPPATKADEIVSPGGGMYYAQEAPGMPQFVSEGMHFDKGQPLFILEVMKMFNKVPAPFSGTIDKIIIEGGDGVIIQKGQPLFKITPDEKFVEIDPKALLKQKQTVTTEYLQSIL